MALVVPDAAEARILESFLAGPLTLRLFGNNYVPIATSLAANFTEIVGNIYTSQPLLLASWVITLNNPSLAVHPMLSWVFTGIINAPGTIYGYFVTRDSDGFLMWAERFDAAYAPIVPINNSIIQLVPQFSSSSVY